LATKGAVSGKAVAMTGDTIVFVGGGENEAPSLWACDNSNLTELADYELRRKLATLSQDQIASIKVETLRAGTYNLVMVHLPNRTECIDLTATKETGQPIWFALSSGQYSIDQYLGRHHLVSYGGVSCGSINSPKFGRLSRDAVGHFGDQVYWEFVTPIFYAENLGLLIKSMELITRPGTGPKGDQPCSITTEYSIDGVTWSAPRARAVPEAGDRRSRITWLTNNGFMRQQRIQRFHGRTNNGVSFVRLEAQIERLAR
jgi:hypothetical protein